MKFAVVLSVQPAGFKAATLKGDVAANLRRIASWGYDGVELAIRDPTAIDTSSLLALVHSCGLQVAAIGTGQAFTEEGLSLTHPQASVRKAAMARLLAHLPLAARAQAILIVGLLRGKSSGSCSREQALVWLTEALSRCAEAAADMGVRLALEPICQAETDLVNNTSEGLRLIEMVGAPNLGLLLDTYHMSREEDSLAGALRRGRSRLFHVHLADSNRRRPGKGNLNFPAILSVLEEIGFQGWSSGEFLPEPDAETAAREALQYLTALRQGGKP